MAPVALSHVNARVGAYLVHNYRQPTRARETQAYRVAGELFLHFFVDHPYWHSAALTNFFILDVPRVRFINHTRGGLGVYSMSTQMSKPSQVQHRFYTQLGFHDFDVLVRSFFNTTATVQNAWFGCIPTTCLPGTHRGAATCVC